MSSSRYVPDSWVVIKASNSDGSRVDFRVIVGWEGNEFFKESRKLSEKLYKMYDKGSHWRFLAIDNSEYICKKDAEGFSKLSKRLFDELVERNYKLTVEVSSAEECGQNVNTR